MRAASGHDAMNGAPRRHIVRFLAIGVATLLVACDKPAAPAADIRPVRTVTVTPHDVTDALVQTGEIRARTEADLGFRIDGKIVGRPVDVGSVVHPGELLAVLDDQPARSKLRSAQAAVTAAEAEVARAGGEQERQSTLIADGFATQQRYEMAVRDLRTAAARLEAQRAQLALAKENLQYTELRAETDGVVTAVYADPGQVVAAGQKVLHLAQPAEREAIFDIPEMTFRMVPRDPRVEVTLIDDPTVKAVGSVRYVSPQADRVTRTYEVRVSLPSAPAAMRLGAAVSGRVELPVRNVVELPTTALFEQAQSAAVWLFDPRTGKVRLHRVTVSRYEGDRVLISAGLAKGDIVVSAGVHLLRPGEKVRLLDAALG